MWCGADAVRRHVADDPDVATILTTAHDIHRISAGRISIARATAAPSATSRSYSSAVYDSIRTDIAASTVAWNSSSSNT